MKRPLSRSAAALLFLLTALSAPRLRAANFTWNGDALLGSQWSRDNNWTGGNAPPSDGTADLFFAGSVRLDAEADDPWSIRSLTFNNGAGGFDITGSTLTIGTGGITNSDNTEQDISNSIVLGAAQTFNTTSTGGLDLNGNVNTNGHLLTVDANTGSVRFFGVMLGGGGLTKTGSGAMIIANGAANTYAGATTVSAGNVQLGLTTDDNGFVKIPGALTINGGNFNVAFNEQIANTSTVTVNSPGSLGLLSGATESIHSLVLSGSTYSGGNATLAIANTLNMTGGTMQGSDGTLTLTGNASIQTSAISSRILLPNLNLAGGTRLFSVNPGAAAADLEISSAIANGSLTKQADGVLRLSGATANTHTTTTVSGGTLELNKTAGVNAIPGSLAISGGGVVRSLKNDQIANTSDLTITSGTLDLNGFSDTVDTLTMTGGAIMTGAGTLTAGNVATTGTGGTSSIFGNLNLGATTRTYNVGDEPSEPEDLAISAVIANGSLSKTGAGTLLLSAANTFAGALTLTAGELAIGNDAAVGTAALSLGTGTAIRAHDAARTIANATSVSGDFTIGGSEDLTFTGPVSLPADRTITVTNTGASAFSGVISQSSGTRGLTKIGTGILAFSGVDANTYTGTTTVNAGILELRKPAGVAALAGPVSVGNGTGSAVVRLFANEQISNSVPVTINASGALTLNGFTQTVGSLTLNTGDVSGAGLLMLAGNLTSGGAGLSEILSNVNLGGAIRTFDVGNTAGAVDLTVNGSVADGGILKTGPGTLRLVFTTNSFADGVTLSAGELAVFGNLGSGALTLNGGNLRSDTAARTVSNAVTMGGNFTVGGALDLTLNGPMTLNGNRTVTVTNTAGTTFSGSIGQDTAGRTLAKAGVGTLRFTGAGTNTYTGVTTVTEGTLILAKSAANGAIGSGGLIIGDGTGGTNADVVEVFSAENIHDSAPVTLNSSGLLRLLGVSEAIGNLTLAGGSTNTGTGTLTLNGTCTSTGAAITAATITGNLVNNGTLHRQGVGTLTITGNVINNGVMRFIGGASLVANGGTFVNNGTLDIITGLASLPANFVNGPGGIVLDSSGVRAKAVTRGGNTLSVTIDSHTGHTYRLQTSLSLTDLFVNIGGTQQGTTGTTLTFNHTDNVNDNRFYRILIDP